MSRHLLQNGRGPMLDIIKYLQSFAVFFETFNFEELLQHFWALWGGNARSAVVALESTHVIM